MGFLYFLPGCSQGTVNFDVLSRYGLSHVVDSPRQHLIHRGCAGPESTHGVIVGAADRWSFGQVKMHDGIEWKRFPRIVGPDNLSPWLGWLKDAGLPKPSQLAREHQIPGESLILADNCEWLVPIARSASGACNLPVLFDVDDHGKWIASKVKRQYESLWNHALSCYEVIIRAASSESETPDYTIPNAESLIVDVLATNYRVSAKELAILGVLDTEICGSLVKVILDFNGTEALKKNVAQDIGNG